MSSLEDSLELSVGGREEALEVEQPRKRLNRLRKGLRKPPSPRENEQPNMDATDEQEFEHEANPAPSAHVGDQAGVIDAEAVHEPAEAEPSANGQVRQHSRGH